MSIELGSWRRVQVQFCYHFLSMGITADHSTFLVFYMETVIPLQNISGDVEMSW